MPMPDGQPFVVSFGGGVDSTAMIIELWRQGQRPDLIMMADTGGEKSGTYGHVWNFNHWLDQVGFPAVTLVRYVPPIAPYKSLEGNCTVNETLPSLAFGMKSCSLKWKAKPQEMFLKRWQPAIDWWQLTGRPIKRAIGYDASPGDFRRATKNDKKVLVAIGLDAGGKDLKRARTYAGGHDNQWFEYVYPLQTWGFDRERCMEVIREVGLRVPPKSSCFFCPAMHKDEILELAATEPDKLERALAMEKNYLEGKHYKGGSTKGLGRRFAWGDVVKEGK